MWSVPRLSSSREHTTHSHVPAHVVIHMVHACTMYMCMYMVTGLTNVLPENAPETEVPNVHHWAGQTGASLEASIMPPVI